MRFVVALTAIAGLSAGASAQVHPVHASQDSGAAVVNSL